MNRTALCIQMLLLLRSRGKMNTNELAEALDTNPRNIREFKKELDTAGFVIEVERGREGGYSLKDDLLMPVMKLSGKEQDALLEAREILHSHPEYGIMDSYDSAMDKVLASQSVRISDVRHYVPLRTIPLGKREAYWKELIEKACRLQNCLQISYQKIGAREAESYEVEPYALVQCDTAYYMVGWSRKSNAFRTWRISKTRLKDVIVLPETFEKDPDFRLKDYISTDSVFKGNMEEYTIEVSLGSEPLFLELYWGADLTCISRENESAVYTFISDQPVLIVRQLFSLLDGCRLLRPEKLVEDYVRDLKSILKVYSLS